MRRIVAILSVTTAFVFLTGPRMATVVHADREGTSTFAIEAVSGVDQPLDVRALPALATPVKEIGPLKSIPPIKPDGDLPDRDVFDPLDPMPSSPTNFEGMALGDDCGGVSCGGGWPPDTAGDVGLNHYIQAVNTSYAIYSKTGTRLAAFTENALFAGHGSLCSTNSSGDPIVLYDHFSDRWILTHFAFTSFPDADGPFLQCFAVSKSGDPVAGGWWLYAIRIDTGAGGQPPVGALNDYGKFGVWNDQCLYMGYNMFSSATGSYIGAAFGSLSLSDMYLGLPVTGALGFLPFASPYTEDDAFSMFPSNLTGQADAPPGTPNYFVAESAVTYNWQVRKLTTGANCGAGGVLTAPTIVSQAETSYAASAVPQFGTTQTLDQLSDRVMQKVQYRMFNGQESLWVTNNVAGSTGKVAPQWAQLDVTGGTIATAPVQDGIHEPDTTLHRWMGSIAADRGGNAALGYSTSSSTTYPSIAYAGRLATDPLDTLPRTEVQMVAGTGSQTTYNRWGDYSAMSVDPVDDCTFWYTTEYYASTGTNWHTRIGSFKFDECVPAVGNHQLAAVSLGAEVMVSGRSTANELWYRETAAGSFGPWMMVDTGSSVAGGPEGIRRGDGDVYYFFRGPSGDLRYAVRDGVGSTWASGSLGGLIAGDPVVALDGDDDVIVVVTGPAGDLWYRRLATGSDTFDAWASTDGAFPSFNTALVAHGGDLYLFGLDTTGGAWTRTWARTTNSWGSWTNLGGYITSSELSAVSFGGELHFIILGGGGNLYYRTYSGAWEAWAPMDGQLTKTLAGVSLGGELVVAGVNGAGASWSRTSSDGDVWNAWSAMDGVVASTAEMVATTGAAHYFVTTVDGGVWFRKWNGATWDAWTSLGGALAIS